VSKVTPAIVGRQLTSRRICGPTGASRCGITMLTAKAVIPRGKKRIDVSNAVKPRSTLRVRLYLIDTEGRRCDAKGYLVAGW
jgi:hypothetical protein